jgi:hypothetical protein
MVRTPGTDRLHFWDCSPGAESRFDQLTPQGAGCRGRRTVDNLFIGDEPVALAKLLRRPLHLVFFRGTLSGDGVVKETGRDWLTLYLDTVPDSQKAAAKGHLEALVDTRRPMDEREAALQGLAGMGRQGIQALDAVTFEAAIHAREAGAVADLRAIISAEAAYAAGNGGFFDGPPCLLEPQKCRPKYSGTPFLTMRMLEATNGYKKLFLPGAPPPSSDEIKKAKASPSSLKDYIVVAWPETFGETGYRAFCADSSGKVCFVEGASPPAKNGRCEARCSPLP